MSTENPVDEQGKPPQGTDFGIFYPIGYLVVALPEQEVRSRFGRIC